MPLDPTRWKLTRHALERAVDMDLTPTQIEALLEKPEITRIQGGQSKYAGDTIQFRGDHAVTIAADVEPEGIFPRTVTTFLYRYQDDYEAQYSMPIPGRERRTVTNLPRKHTRSTP